MSINQSPLAQRVSLAGSAEPNDGSHNPSLSGLKSSSKIDGQYQGGTTHHPPPQDLHLKPKRSQNESAEKIKRLQKLMDEGEIFSNFNQSDDQCRMVSWTSEGIQHFSNNK